MSNAVANYLDADRFVFTSSGGVYTQNDGGMVDEDSDVIVSQDMASRTVGILQAEKAVLKHPGGIVLRYGGLYTLYVDFRRQCGNVWIIAHSATRDTHISFFLRQMHLWQASHTHALKMKWRIFT